MKLVVVESPTKARTISRFLGSEFLVKSSFGHVRDLPKSKLGIDVEHNFEPTYLIPAKAKPVIADLKASLKNIDTVLLATDPDREGEAIAWHLIQALGLSETRKEKQEKRDIQRIVFHEITPGAIKESLEHPRKIDNNLVDAQQARRVLDRLVGYELSPFLWRKIRYGLSAGRVQSVAVRLVVEREREIQNFKKQEYWGIEADLTKQNDNHTFRARLIKIGGKALGKMDIQNQTEAEKIVKDLDGANYIVSEITKKEAIRTPAPPFTTATLQQEASRKFGMSAKQTMMIAQQLYEGINIGEGGHTGLITYMRTDSVSLAGSALSQAKQVIDQHFGKSYSLDKPRFYSNKSKNAQEAHEAIRPTDLSRIPDSIKKYLDPRQYKIYDLIWKRTIASQMEQAVFDQTSVDIKATNDHIFRATGQIVKFDGFIRAYMEGKDENGDEESESQLPKLIQNETLDLKKLLPLQHFTEPPGRYTDATLIKVLEANGIGRPSTYAPIISTIQDRGYVEKIERRFIPTETGYLVNDMLVENFPEIIDVNFTSHIEDELDDIAQGKIAWQPVIEEFYTPFKKHLVEKEASVEKLTETSETPCPHCGKMMMIKFGRMGKFLACPDPESKVTMPLPEEAAQIKELEEKTKDERCPLCGKPMAVKRGRFGYFLGCTDYPKCKGVTKILEKTGFKCPNCLTRQSSQSDSGPVGDIVLKKSRGRGKPFYACSRYPDCTFLISKKPESETELNDALKTWLEKPKKSAKVTKKA